MTTLKLNPLSTTLNIYLDILLNMHHHTMVLLWVELESRGFGSAPITPQHMFKWDTLTLSLIHILTL